MRDIRAMLDDEDTLRRMGLKQLVAQESACILQTNATPVRRMVVCAMLTNVVLTLWTGAGL